eukprot:TRINITY_DN3319_c0_g1_i3.p1 TRINITY_DN3319_c0_g1~~TRINITY_DN3319_c0_g1_i3.p1  ORF type:complete len:151 (+),score=20.66 TRINITY_DN3319_c0_g1_i3:455-907(+)
MTDQWKAATAETENVKRIMKRDVARAHENAVDKLAKKLFSMSDTLDICIQNKPDFTIQPHKDNIHAQRAFDGLLATKDLFLKILKEMNIEEVTPKPGEAFDPHFHDALFEIEAPANSGAGPGTIGLVLKTGWKRDSALLRPASVGVVRRN